LNAARKLESHHAYIGIGSNISPEDNLRSAVALLSKMVRLEQLSSVWESPAIGSSGPNFLNAAGLIYTKFTALALKKTVLQAIENRLGRTRTINRNAPRTVDLDILVFDGVVMEPELWLRPYEAVPLAELVPDLYHPVNREPLWSIAQTLARTIAIHPYQMTWQLDQVIKS
jgi:2-amino-4-hydroxy-6-hydroxymethyldihydropteridine diphosphokinase